jgi:hypothetical protein
VLTWPATDRPALRGMSAGECRYAPVRTRQNWRDGTVRYQVEVDLFGDARVSTRTYEWPQHGVAGGAPERLGAHQGGRQGRVLELGSVSRLVP